VRNVIALLFGLGLLLAAGCDDGSPPSPQEIVLDHNLLVVKGLTDPCNVSRVEIIIVKDGTTTTLLETEPLKTSVDLRATLPRPPFTLTLAYSDGAGNNGTLTWTVSYLPYTPHTLEKMVITGTKALVLVNPPPARPALPEEYGDPNFQNGAWLLVAGAAFLVGLIRASTSRSS